MHVYEIFDNKSGHAIATCRREKDAMDLVSEHNDRVSAFAWDYEHFTLPDPIMHKRVTVKAWFDHRAWEGTVIAESSGDFGARMLLVAPDKGAACWRSPDDVKPAT